jgi:hypothetical protein
MGNFSLRGCLSDIGLRATTNEADEAWEHFIRVLDDRSYETGLAADR